MYCSTLSWGNGEARKVKRQVGKDSPYAVNCEGDPTATTMVKTHHMPRTCQYALLVLQLISTFERQIFDFLGYMWLPILGNFFNIIFVIFGLFGLYQYRLKYLVVYAVWTLVWVGYNVFIICYYLELGDLDKQEDILSFGAGSFSWWMVNSPGCRPVYNATQASEDSEDTPDRPSGVEECVVRYEKIEVTHAAIQIVISTLGFILSILIIHHYVTVVSPSLEKQGVKAMYSIEYSPQHRESNTLERETDLQVVENGDLRGHMTPRRVKRRSYRNSTRNSKSMNRQNNRQSGRSARSSGRSHKSINPVTRLIDADQNRADSSTSNDAERYGQINPGFQTDNSRPNSIYNLSGPPTDIESARPPSALTSYSNFHGQRRHPVGPSTARNVTNLTQESLLNHEHNMNGSYDDLPPPPPPLSSSPAPQEVVSDSDNTSSVATAQLPVPQTRGSTRRNEYVNIPLQKNPSPPPGSSQQVPEQQIPPPASANGGGAPPPVPPHNYANMQDTRVYNGARPRPSNPLYSKTELDLTTVSRYSEMDRSTGLIINYEAETLRADTKLVQPGLYNDPYSLSDVPSQRSSQSEAYPPSSIDLYMLPTENQYGQRPLPQSPRQLTVDPSARHGGGGVDPSIGNPRGARGQVPAPPERFSYNNDRFPPAYDPLRYTVTEAGIHGQTTAAAESMKRVPNGHMVRDRVSLRAKQKRDMETRASKRNIEHKNVPNGYTNAGAPAPHQSSYTGRSTADPDPEDKWYMKDSMRPVGASHHGESCKCYRCQRKLTAI